MISEKEIMRKVYEYAKSPEGKKKIKEKYGVDYNEKVNIDKVYGYAMKMKHILFRRINPIIKSIQLDDIVIGEPTVGKDGRFEIHLSFAEGSLHRESLDPDRFPKGLDNIILLFKKGYDPHPSVYGDWIYNGKEIANGIWSRRSREPNDFLDKAIIEFNSSAKNVAVAMLEGEYAN